MAKSKKTYSLSDLDATQAASEAFKFEYMLPNGEGSGIILHVLGGQSEAVTKEVAKLVNERRRKDAMRQAKKGFKNKDAEFETFESDVEFGQRLASVRLVGWEGIAEPCTPENALKLCMSNKDIAAQVTEQSDDIANFMKL